MEQENRIIGVTRKEKYNANILVIDDSEDDVRILKNRLVSYGWNAFTTSTLEEAREVLKSNDIDVICLLFEIEESKGLEFLDMLKNTEEYANIPVIITSSIRDASRITMCIEHGAEEYLLKPFNQSVLRARLMNAVAKKRAHDLTVARMLELQEKNRQSIETERMNSLTHISKTLFQELQGPLNLAINLSDISNELFLDISNKIQSKNTDDSIDNIRLLGDNVSKISDNLKKIDKTLKFLIDQSSTSDATIYNANLNSIITEIVKTLIADYKSSSKTLSAKIKLKLDNKIPKSLPLAVEAIGKALYNLIENSLCSLQQKGDSFEKTIKISTKNYPEYVEIGVYDNGNGVDIGITKKIFEPFFTTDQTNTHIGLGLTAVSEAIVRIHNGTVRVNSQVGQYAEFVLTIPKYTKI